MRKFSWRMHRLYIILLIAIFFGFSCVNKANKTQITSWNGDSNSCVKDVSKKLTANNFPKDSFLIISKVIDSNLNVEIINNKQDTFYLFSGYLNEFFYSAEFTKKIDTVNKRLTLSFVPIIPARRKPYHYTYYFFVKMLPYSYYSCDININTLKVITNENANSTINLNSYDPIINLKAQFYNMHNLDESYSTHIEMGIYKDIRFLCYPSRTVLDSNLIKLKKSQALNYKIIKAELPKELVNSLR